jgi:hypothetical protein
MLLSDIPSERLFEVMVRIFMFAAAMPSARRASAVAIATIIGGALAGCGSPSPAGSSAPGQGSASAAAGLPSGQGSFSIQSATTAFNSDQQSSTGHIQGEVDGLALTATGNGTASGQDEGCFFGTLGSSVSGTLGGVPFTIKLTACDLSQDHSQVTGTYAGTWGSRPVNITATENLASDQARNGNSDMGTDLPTLSGTVGSQTVNASVTMPQTFATEGPNGITGSITVS